ncbi:hypothetical protein ACFSTA_12380 [Ornithinibacillus salinisoli]|uniref:Phage protein n=1 Tax=Ornithinibacillus salinisoli TaxID=1848459 RepID=A0ABW4W5B0_9BACI
MIVWIVLYTEYMDDEQVLGAFDSEEAAKYFIGNYALKNDIHSENLNLVKTKVEVNQ